MKIAKFHIKTNFIWKTNAMHLKNIRLAVLPMNPKRWWRENKTDCKLKKRQKYNKKPQNTKQTTSCHALCGRVNKSHDRTIHGHEPHTKCTRAHISRQLT